MVLRTKNFNIMELTAKSDFQGGSQKQYIGWDCLKSTELSEMILKRKEDYYCLLSDKLNNLHTGANHTGLY